MPFYPPEPKREPCAGPKCHGGKAVIVGARVTPGLITRLCADCLPLVPGAKPWPGRVKEGV